MTTTGEMKRMEWDGRNLAPLDCTNPMLVELLSDPFDGQLTEAETDELMAVVAITPQHTYLVSTKHGERMAQYFDEGRPIWASYELETWFDKHNLYVEDHHHLHCTPDITGEYYTSAKVWPLPNLWLGLTVRTQDDLDEQAKHLLACPASVRWLDVRPSQGVDLAYREYDEEGTYIVYPLKGNRVYWRDDRAFNIPNHDEPCERIHWVRVTGESEPMHPDWVRTIRDQCKDAGVPFSFEGWGEWAPVAAASPVQRETTLIDPQGRRGREIAMGGEGRVFMDRVGADKSGRLLDGREHNDMPGQTTN